MKNWSYTTKFHFNIIQYNSNRNLCIYADFNKISYNKITMKNTYRLFSASLFVIMVIETITSGTFSSAYAGEDNHDNNDGDNVKVDCNDVGIALATLSLAYGNLDEEGNENLEESLQEDEISMDVDALRDNLQNVLETVEDKCEDVDFIGFVDFDSEDFVVD